MVFEESVEKALKEATLAIVDERTPPKLAQCIDYALFPGGARIRPRLLMAVAAACDANSQKLVNSAAAAVEMLHCASLVQDDLQFFDDAELRRGRTACHHKFSAGMAILAADALIVGSFDVLSSNLEQPSVSLALVNSLSRHTGAKGGITAGQAWESEPNIDTTEYHIAKTGALFAACTELGALCGGADPVPWFETGELIGRAYQIGDDLRDVLGETEQCGKPVGVDADLQRPNFANENSTEAAVLQIRSLIEEVVETMPECPNRGKLQETIRTEATRFVPSGVKILAA